MPDKPTPNPRVPDADPSADVYVRADRTLWGIETRNRRTYHLFADCDHLANGYGRETLHAGDIWREGLPVCTDCERREEVRAMLAEDVPANPSRRRDRTPGTDRRRDGGGEF